MKLGSLFDGSGGFPLAGCLCGIEPAWASEVEPYPIAVTRSRFPNMKHLGDISKINGAEVEPVDIITFGSPCQDLSVAGKRAGLKHEANGDEETTRSGLFMEAVRIIREMKEATHGRYPSYALWENVPGAFSSNGGEDFRIVLEELIKIVEPSAVMPAVPKNGWPYADSYCGDGWSLAYRVFDAQYWGVPQRRRRIHLVLDLRGERAREVLFEREGVRGYFAEGRTPWKGAAAHAEDGVGADDREGAGVGEKAWGIDHAITTGGNCTAQGPCVYEDIQATLKASGPHAVAYATPYTLKIRSGCEGGGNGALIQTDKSATLATNNDRYLFQPVTLEPGIAAREGGHIYEGVSGTLRAEAGDNRMAVAHMVLDDQGGQQINVRTDDKCPTLRAEAHGNVPAVVEAHSGTNQTPAVRVAISIHDKATRYKGGGPTRNGDGAGNGLGVAEAGAPAYTVTTGDRHAVAYLASGNEVVGCLQAGPAERGFYTAQELFSGNYHIIEEREQPSVRYIVRRLTPTECARLQGFADRWGDIDEKTEFSDEEYRFWLEVRNTHATVIGGKEAKEHTKEQMLTWYNKLQTDSSEYKMWGNGIALPPALYCMQGITDVLQRLPKRALVKKVVRAE